jgi:hypothetical protein
VSATSDKKERAGRSIEHKSQLHYQEEVLHMAKNSSILKNKIKAQAKLVAVTEKALTKLETQATKLETKLSKGREKLNKLNEKAANI